MFAFLLTNISCSPPILFLDFLLVGMPFWSILAHFFDTEINIKTHSDIISATLRCWFCVKSRVVHDSCLANIFRKISMDLGNFTSEKWPKSTFFVTNVKIRRCAIKNSATSLGSHYHHRWGDEFSAFKISGEILMPFGRHFKISIFDHKRLFFALRWPKKLFFHKTNYMAMCTFPPIFNYI